jgi:lipopolysaccharide export system ATP-binding protein
LSGYQTPLRITSPSGFEAFVVDFVWLIKRWGWRRQKASPAARQAAVQAKVNRLGANGPDANRSSGPAPPESGGAGMPARGHASGEARQATGRTKVNRLGANGPDANRSPATPGSAGAAMPARGHASGEARQAAGRAKAQGSIANGSGANRPGGPVPPENTGSAMPARGRASSEARQAAGRAKVNGSDANRSEANGSGPAPAASSGAAMPARTGATAEARPAPRDYLAVHRVEKSFAGRKVVKGVSLYVRRGEAVGLLGPNGAGKTTVFYMITGLIKADVGRIHLEGYDVTSLPMYQRARLGIGYLPQEASIFRGLNVEENIRAVLEMIEPSKRRREAELDSLLEEFNIARLRKTPTIALSGGERRRVEIARALATRPNYMLLDEPFAGIDPIAVGDIQALVRHLTQRGIGVLITDHNVRETLGLTDRAYIIYSGEVLMEGEADDIVNNPDVRRLYLGEEFRM